MSQRITTAQRIALTTALDRIADTGQVVDGYDAVLAALDLQPPHPPATIAVLHATSDVELERARLVAKAIGDAAQASGEHVRAITAHVSEHLRGHVLHGFVVPPGCNPSQLLLDAARFAQAAEYEERS